MADDLEALLPNLDDKNGPLIFTGSSRMVGVWLAEGVRNANRDAETVSSDRYFLGC